MARRAPDRGPRIAARRTISPGSDGYRSGYRAGKRRLGATGRPPPPHIDDTDYSWAPATENPARRLLKATAQCRHDDRGGWPQRYNAPIPIRRFLTGIAGNRGDPWRRPRRRADRGLLAIRGRRGGGKESRLSVAHRPAAPSVRLWTRKSRLPRWSYATRHYTGLNAAARTRLCGAIRTKAIRHFPCADYYTTRRLR